MHMNSDRTSDPRAAEMADPGVSRAAITAAVRDVYAQAGADHLLADHLKEAMGRSRGPYIEHACRFWASALVPNEPAGAGPAQVDVALASLSPCCFQRWLALFRTAIRARWAPPVADRLVRRVEEIAHGIRSGAVAA